MRVLYAGQYGPGSTSKMRAEHLASLLSPADMVVCDQDEAFARVSRLSRSLGWRYFRGPLVTEVSRSLDRTMERNDMFDLAWVDKGVFLKRQTLERLRRTSRTLVHYTPDCAFAFNRSPHFISGVDLYDHCITTKSFELEAYRAHGARNVIFCTQGYDARLHYPRHVFREKSGVLFIGLSEPSRCDLLAALLKAGIPVSLAGKGWDAFIREHGSAQKEGLTFLGEGLFGEDYARALSGSLVCLGLLSKKFPEKHTTRTFEIPACGSLLATERNDEIKSFFTEDEVLYFDDTPDLVRKLKAILDDRKELERRSLAGLAKVKALRVDYEGIMRELLARTGIW